MKITSTGWIIANEMSIWVDVNSVGEHFDRENSSRHLIVYNQIVLVMTNKVMIILQGRIGLHISWSPINKALMWLHILHYKMSQTDEIINSRSLNWLHKIDFIYCSMVKQNQNVESFWIKIILQKLSVIKNTRITSCPLPPYCSLCAFTGVDIYYY